MAINFIKELKSMSNSSSSPGMTLQKTLDAGQHPPLNLAKGISSAGNESRSDIREGESTEAERSKLQKGRYG